MWNNEEYEGITWNSLEQLQYHELLMPHRCLRWPSRAILARRAVFQVFWSPEHRAISSCSTLFHCIPLYSILSHTMYPTLFHGIPLYSIRFHAISCCSILFYVIPRCSTLFHAIPLYSMLVHGIPCYSMLIYVNLCMIAIANDSVLKAPCLQVGRLFVFVI